MTSPSRRARAVLALSLAVLSGCGYALVGRGTVVDPTIKKIAVPLFKDSTGKPGLDQKITQKVTEELLKRGRFDVVQDRVGADAIVEGEILRYDQTPVGFSDAGGSRSQASRYAVTLTARVRYLKVGQEEPIWASESFAFRDEYDVGSDPTAFARLLVAAMLEAF